MQQINQARNVGSQQQLAARQQDVGNIQSYLGLQPIAAQGAAMSGLQQGASPFTMPQMQRGMGLDPNAGAAGTGFASNIFGTQANIYNTQMSNQSNPLGAVAGTLAGSAAGGFGTKFGRSLV